jgi:hypothetical protein
MTKKKEKQNTSGSSKRPKSSIGKANKRKGNAFEREVMHKLQDAGYDVATTRATDQSLDAKKCDIFSKDGLLPTTIQCKYTQATPNYFGIKSECPIKDKPFTIIWKKAMPDGKNSPGTLALVEADFFYELLKLYRNN